MRIVATLRARGSEEYVGRLDIIVNVAGLMQAAEALDDVAPDLKYKVMPLRRAWLGVGVRVRLKVRVRRTG